MFRDFSDEAKEQLLGYVNEVTPKGTWDSIIDCVSDWGLVVDEWLGKLDVSNYITDLKSYHSKIIDKNDTSSQQIEQIFTDVNAVDSKYSAVVIEAVNTAKQLVKYINNMADSIDPSGGKFTVGYIEEVLGIDRANLEENQVNYSSALTTAEQTEIATSYVDEVAGLNLTYEEFLMLSKEQQQAYINQAGKYVFALYPGVELEAGKYEITVPIGIDMTATYSVTVTGTCGDSEVATVSLTIEQQQVVLESVNIENSSAKTSIGADAVGFQGTVGNTSLGMTQSLSGGAEVSATITTGASEASLVVEGDINKTSVKYEVETTLSDELSVTSAIEVEKSNNTNMPEWEPIPVAVYEGKPESEYNFEIDGETVVEGATVVLVLYGVYKVVKWQILSFYLPVMRVKKT